MARGNQRDKAREANQKKMADQVGEPRGLWAISIVKITCPNYDRTLQKKSNSMSGTEMQREKEKVAKMMREKQAAGMA